MLILYRAATTRSCYNPWLLTSSPHASQAVLCDSCRQRWSSSILATRKSHLQLARIEEHTPAARPALPQRGPTHRVELLPSILGRLGSRSRSNAANSRYAAACSGSRLLYGLLILCKFNLLRVRRVYTMTRSRWRQSHLLPMRNMGDTCTSTDHQ